MRAYRFEEVEEVKEILRTEGEPKRCILLAADAEPEEKIKEVAVRFTEEGFQVAGGVFPGLIFNSKAYKKGFLAVFLDSLKDTVAVRNISLGVDPKDIRTELKEGTVLVFVDGLSSGINLLLESLYTALGNRFVYLGGGTGSLEDRNRKSLIDGNETFSDGALLMFLEKKLKVKVKHGWKRIYGPFLATDTEGHAIRKINWEPAFDFYKRVLKDIEGVEISEGNFFEVAKSYPFGMIREKHEEIIRDPIAINKEGAIICVGDVPKNAVLFLMKGDKKSLIEASSKVVSRGKYCLIFDCISRALLLGEDIEEELKRACGKLKLSAGSLTLGEVASLGSFEPRFLNKTVVAGVGD